MTSHPETKLNRIIWALDPLKEPGELYPSTVQVIKNLQKSSPGVEIEPVFVLSPGQLDLSLDFSKSWVENYRPAAERQLQERVTEAGLSNCLPPRMILQPLASTRHAVESLVTYAESSETNLIVLSTHGRKGLWRLLMGSFAETLILQSPVPVLTVGPETQRIHTFEHLLFPTDFSNESRHVFRSLVHLAKELNARVTLFHALPTVIEPVLQSGAYLLGGNYIPVRGVFDAETDNRRKLGQAWEAWGVHHGAKTEFVLDESIGPPLGTIAERISDLASKIQADAIALASRTGPIASSLIGSTTRQVVRISPCPVWVLHYTAHAPHSRAPARKEAA